MENWIAARYRILSNMSVETKPADIASAQSLVARALAVSVDCIGPEARMHELRIWDSLGHLSVILAVEEMLQKQITDESTFQSLTSVRGIAEYLSQSRERH